jgi:DNA-binding MarR family transcriptional regulator
MQLRSPTTHASMKLWAYKKDVWVVPKEILELQGMLTANEFILLCYIYNNEVPERGVRLSKQLIAADVNMKTITLTSVLARLEELGLIIVERNQGHRQANCYHSFIFGRAREEYLKRKPRETVSSVIDKRNPETAF